jgi:hypothetical protein
LSKKDRSGSGSGSGTIIPYLDQTILTLGGKKEERRKRKGKGREKEH